MADLDRIRGNNFVIIGRAGMDFYPDPPGTKTEEANHFFACLGGSSANIGVAITRHGGKAALVTRVSDDAIGRFAQNELDRYGVDRTHVKSVGGEARNSLAVVETRVEDLALTRSRAPTALLPVAFVVNERDGLTPVLRVQLDDAPSTDWAHRKWIET